MWWYLGLVAVPAALALVVFSWRWASRAWVLPCPWLFAFALESPLYGRLTGTQKTLDRIGLKPGQRVLEIGPGPGRLLLPAAARVLPSGQAVGIELQAGMVERLRQRAAAAGVTNLVVIHGDATQPHVPAESCDVAFLVTTLGEIPHRQAVLEQCYRALKPGGRLSITEMLPDPHYQSQSTVARLATAAGFRPLDVLGHVGLFTANFEKPA